MSPAIDCATYPTETPFDEAMVVTKNASTATEPAPQTLARRLRGRRIVVTGAASGIGRATAQLFASEGASLTLLDRDERGVAQIAQETGGLGIQVDITNEKAVADA